MNAAAPQDSSKCMADTSAQQQKACVHNIAGAILGSTHTPDLTAVNVLARTTHYMRWTAFWQLHSENGRTYITGKEPKPKLTPHTTLTLNPNPGPILTLDRHPDLTLNHSSKHRQWTKDTTLTWPTLKNEKHSVEKTASHSEHSKCTTAGQVISDA